MSRKKEQNKKAVKVDDFEEYEYDCGACGNTHPSPRDIWECATCGGPVCVDCQDDHDHLATRIRK